MVTPVAGAGSGAARPDKVGAAIDASAGAARATASSGTEGDIGRGTPRRNRLKSCEARQCAGRRGGWRGGGWGTTNSTGSVSGSVLATFARVNAAARTFFAVKAASTASAATV